MMTLSARPRTAATNSNLRDDPFAMSPNTTGSHPSASKRTSYASNVLRFPTTNTTLFGLGLGCSMIQSGTDTLRSNRPTRLCGESEGSRMASSRSENSERRLSNLSASVFPPFAALLPVTAQPATDTPTATAHPAMATHNPSIGSSPIRSEWRPAPAVPPATSVGEPSGGRLPAARHHTHNQQSKAHAPERSRNEPDSSDSGDHQHRMRGGEHHHRPHQYAAQRPTARNDSKENPK